LVAGLVAGQMTLAVVLLSGAGVLVRSLANIVGADGGVRDPSRILVGSLRVPSEKRQTADERSAYFDRVQQELHDVHGVDAVALASAVPISASGFLRMFEIEGRPNARDREPSAQFLTIGVGYFRVVGTAALAGRDFDDRDRLAAPPVAIVNQS